MVWDEQESGRAKNLCHQIPPKSASVAKGASLRRIAKEVSLRGSNTNTEAFQIGRYSVTGMSSLSGTKRGKVRFLQEQECLRTGHETARIWGHVPPE